MLKYGNKSTYVANKWRRVFSHKVAFQSLPRKINGQGVVIVSVPSQPDNFRWSVGVRRGSGWSSPGIPPSPLKNVVFVVFFFHRKFRKCVTEEVK